jgi:cell division cycle 14
MTEHLYLPLINGILALSEARQSSELPTSHFQCISAEKEVVYRPFADDFGPLDLSSLSRFMSILQRAVKTRNGKTLVYTVDITPRSLTNAAFLLGSYMMIEMGYTSNAVWDAFSSIEPMLEMYRDAQSSPASFHLEVIDCWRGVERANVLGWIDAIDMEEYDHYSNPLEGDLHFVIPDKLIAFRGPVQLQGSQTYSDVAGVRFFAPVFFVDPFLDMGVSTIIRLNSLAYDPTPLRSAGIRCLHIDIGEDSIPTPRAILAFLDAVAAAEGVVAVHCTEGRGRTGTLAAAHLMAAHGFSAREAIGWLRVVRPGSVVGAQQHFLCRLGDALRARAGGGAAGVREAVLSLEKADADRPCSEAMLDGHEGAPCRHRCTSAPLERGRRQQRARPQSDV